MWIKELEVTQKFDSQVFVIMGLSQMPFTLSCPLNHHQSHLRDKGVKPSLQVQARNKLMQHNCGEL